MPTVSRMNGQPAVVASRFSAANRPRRVGSSFDSAFPYRESSHCIFTVKLKGFSIMQTMHKQIGILVVLGLLSLAGWQYFGPDFECSAR